MRLSIQYKITIIIAAIVAVILSGIYFYLNSNLQELTFQNIRKDLSSELNLAQSYIENNYTDLKNISHVDDVADQIGGDLGIRATVIALDGKVLGDSELEGQALLDVENHLYRPEVQDAINKGHGESRRFSTTVQKDMLYMAEPFGKGQIKGIARLAIPLSEIEIITDKLRRMLALSLFVAFGLTIAIGLFTSFYVSKPITEIFSTAKSIAEGDFSKRVTVKTNDEIEDLGKAINFMSEQIKTRMDEVISNKTRFETILLSMFEGVMVVDGNGVITLMNETLRQFFGVDYDPVGRKPLEVIRNIEIQEMVDKILELKDGVESKEISIMVPSEKSLQIHATPVVRGDSVDGGVVVFHDITELRRLENIRRDFVANVSHELRTPITSIKGYSETLLGGAMEEKENATEFLKIITTESERLSQLVEDLLDLSTIESGKLDLDIHPIKIDSVVERILLGFKKQIKEKKITIKNNITGSTPRVNADEKSVAQVLLNLIDNAVKYNKNGGLITISAEKEDNHLKISVSDTGIGIPQEDCPRIFERFYRVDKARSRQLGGTGLGLAIAKHIVQAHGGHMSVESEPNRGTDFSFTLPTV